MQITCASDKYYFKNNLIIILINILPYRITPSSSHQIKKKFEGITPVSAQPVCVCEPVSLCVRVSKYVCMHMHPHSIIDC